MTQVPLPVAFRVQSDVIGALILRELHTRFGRQNIGYLWLFAEPLLLAIAVALLHSQSHLPVAGGVLSIPFAISGYTLFIMFRSMVSRAETMLEANRPLLNHRQVTILDMAVARALLELASTAVVLTLLLSAAWLVGLANPPADIVAVVGAVLLLGWFSFAVSMVVIALGHESPMAGRLVHPLLYLSMPLSGAFFAMPWLPSGLRDMAAWIPTVPMFELMRAGQFDGYPDADAGLTYPIATCAVLTLIGLAALRLLRPRVQIA
jgi:capsular polysaccharide transport system permease protein